MLARSLPRCWISRSSPRSQSLDVLAMRVLHSHPQQVPQANLCYIIANKFVVYTILCQPLFPDTSGHRFSDMVARFWGILTQ